MILRIGKTALLCIVLIIASGCAHMNVMDGGYLLDKKDLALMKQTTEAIDFDFGYDSEFDVFYVYTFEHAKKSSLVKERELAKVIAAVDVNDLASFYYKVIKIHASLDHKVGFFKERRDWKNHTYYKNYLLPPVEEFRALMKKSVIARNAAFIDIDRDGEKRAKNWVEWYYRYQEEPVDTILH